MYTIYIHHVLYTSYIIFIYIILYIKIIHQLCIYIYNTSYYINIYILSKESLRNRHD